MLSDLPRPRAWRREPAVSVRVDPQHPFAALDQKPLQRRRDVPAVLDRPHAIVAQPARPSQQTCGALGARQDGLLAEQLAGRR